jgi:hypothetical protein
LGNTDFTWFPGPKKIKKAKYGHKQFQKGQILKNEKKPNKGQIFFKKIVKITKLKFSIS